MTDPLRTIEEIEEQVQKANLSSDDEGDLHPYDAAHDIQVTDGRSCGEHGFGRFLGIRNTNRSRRIRAYYQISSNVNGPWQGNRTVGPGQTEWITCSYPAPNQYMSIEITGAYYE